jgi:hypothetical protein
MQTPVKYAPPLTVAEYAAYEANIRVLRTMAHRQECTPLVENSDPAGVALGGNDGQGVCAHLDCLGRPLTVGSLTCDICGDLACVTSLFADGRVQLSNGFRPFACVLALQ